MGHWGRETVSHGKAAALIAQLFIADGAHRIPKVLNSTQVPWYEFMRCYKEESRSAEGNLHTSTL